MKKSVKCCEEETDNENIRSALKKAVMDMTDEQAEYVLWRLQCLKQENNF